MDLAATTGAPLGWIDPPEGSAVIARALIPGVDARKATTPGVAPSTPSEIFWSPTIAHSW
jgi:hypothetical protein